jgi:hypothetical protein
VIRKSRQEEQLALDQFRHRSGLLPGQDSRGADPPDFIITNGVQRTSVETTAFHKGSGERGGSMAAAQESNAQQLVERAQTVFEAAHPDLLVEVRPYLMRDRIVRRELNQQAKLVADAVADKVPPMPAENVPLTRADCTWADLPDDVANLLSHVSIA